MAILHILKSSVFRIISCLFLVLYLLGVLNLHFSDKNNYCIMTYMYEYPQFVRLSVPENKLYPQYGLYAYSEGRLTEKARKMWFDGIPVLFLPGNSGSHMQARSLASVALRKSLSKDYDYHFDFFTISYNEELSGLYGGVLESQTQFAAASITKILSLYKSNKYTKTVPSSVVLIGHSMGGLIAKRLLGHPSTINVTNIAITLASPLQAPVINFDVAINEYYLLMKYEWELNIKNNEEYRNKKVLISFANGPRDVLMPSALTMSNDNYITALVTAVPGAWVSPDHVCIVWCKQLVMAVNKYLFSIVDPLTEQIVENQQFIKDKARQFFVTNRSMSFDPRTNPRANVTMVADAFWYEDNRRIYQVTRPEIDKTTHLMIRLVKFPQNRFVAVEAVNVDDKDWVFGCNAKFTYHMHRYCKYAESITELSRWTGAADEFGKRKLTTINLHKLMESNPDWTHVIVKVSPTRKPITLNVDINDHASRQIQFDVPSLLSLSKSTIIQETERDSLYYEILLRHFNTIHQAYLLYVEPSASCKASKYHVSAEVHVPWAENQEYYHYFTQAKRSPMKLRLYTSNPNMTAADTNDYVKITLLLDPQCTYTVSISTSWYHRLAQLARNYTPILMPYVAAIILLAARHNILNIKDKGLCVSVHTALVSDSVKPYYALVFSRLAFMVVTSIPLLSFLLENASWDNTELQYFTKSLLVLPAYLTALGIVNVTVAALLVVMVFSSQIAHRLLFRIVWRGGTGLAEKVASGLQKVPMVVSAALVGAALFSCGAASLAAGAAFYAFLLSKMYEEYLEDYFYKLMAKIASKMCIFFKKRDKNMTRPISDRNSAGDEIKWRNLDELEQECFVKKERENRDDDLSNINFHMTMFLMWLIVTVVNVPALLTWARNFKYSTALKPDTSFHTGLFMAVCSTYIWQMDGPRKNLRYYDAVCSLIFTMAVFILALGPFSLAIVNYGVTFMFTVITVQQVLDKDVQLSTSTEIVCKEYLNKNPEDEQNTSENNEVKDSKCKDANNSANASKSANASASNNASESPENNTTENCDVCNESRIYNVFKNLREKFSFNDEDL